MNAPVCGNCRYWEYDGAPFQHRRGFCDAPLPPWVAERAERDERKTGEDETCVLFRTKEGT